MLDCIDEYTKSEILDGDNKWYNEKSNTYENATKRLSIFKQPNVLICILKDFYPREEKIKNMYHFPMILILKNTCMIRV